MILNHSFQPLYTLEMNLSKIKNFYIQAFSIVPIPQCSDTSLNFIGSVWTRIDVCYPMFSSREGDRLTLVVTNCYPTTFHLRLCLCNFPASINFNPSKQPNQQLPPPTHFPIRNRNIEIDWDMSVSGQSEKAGFRVGINFNIFNVKFKRRDDWHTPILWVFSFISILGF